MLKINPAAGFLLVPVALASCGSPDNVPSEDVLQIGPTAAVRDIRDTFSIGDRQRVSIEYVRRRGQERRLVTELRPHDQALMACHIDAPDGEYNIQIFMAPLDPNSRIARRYIVAYRDDGGVLCIEARHETTGSL